MKLNKSIIIPLLILIFASFGLERLVLPYVPFGSGRWSDSLGTNVSNHSARINGNLNITGNFYKNGVLFTGGGSSVPVYDEGSLQTAAMTALNFTGANIATTADVGGNVLVNVTTDPTLLPRSDTTKFGYLNKNNIWTGSNTFGSGTQTIDALYVTSNIVNNGLTQTDTLSVIQGVNVGGAMNVATTLTSNKVTVTDSSGFGNDVTISGFTQLGSSGPAVKQKLITGLSATGNATVTFAHGLSFYKIIGSTIWLRNDTAGTNSYFTAPKWIIAPQTSFSNEVLYYAGLDGTNCWARFPVGAVSTRGDSLFFLITYIE
jgi:hypothetical protein